MRILTYGTFDLFHLGHLNILRRLKELGNHLSVGVSTDEFNASKGKISVYSYAERAAIVAGIRYVDHVFPEQSWDQKQNDIANLKIDVFGMGDDWKGKFDQLKNCCRVIYLPRTEDISTSAIKAHLADSSVAKRMGL